MIRLMIVQHGKDRFITRQGFESLSLALLRFFAGLSVKFLENIILSPLQCKNYFSRLIPARNSSGLARYLISENLAFACLA